MAEFKLPDPRSYLPQGVDDKKGDKEFTLPDPSSYLGTQPQEPKEDFTEFGKGLRRGATATEGLFKGGAAALADVVGAEDLSASLMEGYRESMQEASRPELAPEVGSVRQIEGPGQFFSWLAGVTGEQIPNIVSLAAGGGLGGFLSKKVAEKVISKSAKEYAEQQAKDLIRKSAIRGAGATVFGGASTLETGGIYGEQEEAGVEKDPWVALSGGMLAGALEIAPWVGIAKAMGLGDAAQGSLTSLIREMPRAKRAATLAGLTAGGEAATEATQEIIAIGARKFVDENYDALGEEAANRILESAAAGAAVGGLFGGVGGVVTPNAPETKFDALPEPESPEVLPVEDTPEPAKVTPLEAKITEVEQQVSERLTEAVRLEERLQLIAEEGLPDVPKGLGTIVPEEDALVHRVMPGAVRADEADRLAQLPVQYGTTRGRKNITLKEKALEDGEVVTLGFENIDEFERPALLRTLKTVKQWTHRFAPDMKVAIVDPKTWETIGEVPKNVYGFMGTGKDGTIYMAVDRQTLGYTQDPTRMEFETIAHEWGHGLMSHLFTKASKTVKTALYQQYRQWLNDIQTMTVGEFFDAYGPIGWSQQFSLSSDISQPVKTWIANKTNPSYWISFDEFAAQQIARYMTSKERGRGPVEKFWKDLVAKLKKFFELEKKRFRPGLNFETWLNSLANDAALVRDYAKLQDLRVQQKLEQEEKKSAAKTVDPVTTLATSKEVDIRPEVREELKTQPAKYNKFIRWALTLSQIGDLNQHIPGVSQYIEAVRNWWAGKTVWIERADRRLDQWNMSKRDKEAFAKVLYDMTLESDKLQRELTQDEKLQFFQKAGLENEEVWQLYQNIQGDFKESIRALFDVLKGEARQRFAQDQTILETELQRLDKEQAQLLNRDYFPLTRFGQYWVLVRASKDVKVDGETFQTGDTVRFEMYESEKEMLRGRKEMQRRYKDFLVSGGKLSDTGATFLGMPRQLLQQLERKLDLDPEQKKELNFILNQLAPGQSYKKHLLKRKGTAGFSLDARRAYANYFSHFANHIARIQNHRALTNGIETLEDHITRLNQFGVSVKEQELADHLKRHFDYAMNPGNELANLRSVGFLWYLGFLPKSAVVNFTQVPLVTYPYLGARYGDSKSVKALAKATKEIRQIWAQGKEVEEHLRQALQRGVDAGFLDESLATELAATAEGSNLQRILPGTFLRSERGAQMIRTASHYGAWMFQKAEKINRLVTFTAAYRLALEKELGGRKLEKLQKRVRQAVENSAYLAARDAVEKTQYEYARWNRAEFMRGKKSILFLFWQYMQNTLYFAAQDKGRMRFFMMMMLTAGLSGLPFAEDIMDLLDYVLTKMGRTLGWESPKSDVRLELREFINSLGMHPDLMMHGISRYGMGLPAVSELAGLPVPNVDLSGSLSMGRLVPGAEAVLGREGAFNARLAAAGTDVGGAFVSIPLSIMHAVSSDDPNVLKRVERALPSALRSVSRAYRFATQGEETSYTGARLVEFNLNDPEHLAEIAAQAIGMSPTRIAVERELDWVQKEHSMYYGTRRSMILEQFSYAIRSGDREAIADVRKAVRRFNKSVPTPTLRISSRDIKASLRERQRRRIAEERGLPPTRRDIPLYRDIAERF